MDKISTVLFPKKIYNYQKIDGTIGLCVYVCDTDNANEIIVGCIENIDVLNNDFIKLENGLNKVLYLDKYLTLKTSQIKSPLYIKGKTAEITSKEFNELSKNIYKLLLLKYENYVANLSLNNFENEKLIDITFPENIIKLLTWNLKKIDLNFTKINQQNNLIIMEHCVYFAHMGTNVGSETNKLRPVVVWRKHENKNYPNPNDDCYYVFPISSKISKKEYRYNIKIDINGITNKIMINQGRILSKKRFVKILKDIETQKVVKLTEEQKDKIKIAIKNYFGV